MELTDQERLFRRRRKWIWGCTGGCLSLMVVAAAVLIGIWMWLGKGQPVPPAEAFLTARTGTFVFVRIEPDDPMMVEVPVRLAMQPAVSNQVPTKDNRPLRVDAERMREVVTKVGPIQLVLVGTRSEGEPPLRWGVAASVGHFGRALDFVLQSTARKADMPAREIY